MLIILLGLALGSVINGFARRGSPGNLALVASCLLAGVVGLSVVWIAVALGSLWMVLLVPLGVAYTFHPIALQALCGGAKSRIPYAISAIVSAWWIYIMFFRGN